jgi:creatinine amidohydrolase
VAAIDRPFWKAEVQTMRNSIVARLWILVVAMGTVAAVCSVPANAAEPEGHAKGTKPHGRMEEMRPDDLEKVLAENPVAFVPLGTFEHHGWHLPVCFDGIKAHALCERVAERTGGAVLPTFFYGTGGGHVGYKWTRIRPEKQITPILEATLDHLAAQGFKVVVVLTGHYPKEQVDMAHRLAQEAQARHPKVRFIGLTEPEVTTPQPGDRGAGDHAAKYETSIAMALNPAWVRMDALTAGRDPDKVTLPVTPRNSASTHDPKHPLYAIHGQDPRTTASRELGEKLVAEIVSRLAEKVEQGLAGGRDQTERSGR